MDSFDYIIVGAGAAGCILAGRLTESRDIKVLLLEAGGVPNSFWIPIPAGFSKLMVNSRFNWNFHTEPSDSKYGRSIVIPRGKGLGGSTLINGMIYVKGQPQDYDGWAQRGCWGWSYSDVAPYFEKLEHYQGHSASASRGDKGPMHVTEMAERHEIFDAYLESAKQAGHSLNQDYNGPNQEGVGYYQVTQKDGRRWSVYDGYLKPAMSRPNLKVMTDARVVQILLEGRNAKGVVLRHGGRTIKVNAQREVILSAGAVQTPQLLELSGIGSPEVLSDQGINTVIENRQIGENYIDHFATRMNWSVRKPFTLNELSRGLPLAREVAKYYLMHKGILTLGTGIIFTFVKTRPELETPDVQYFFVHASYANAADRNHAAAFISSLPTSKCSRL